MSNATTTPSPADQIPDLLTTKEVAERLRLSQPTIKRMLTAGELEAFKVGRHWRITLRSVLEYLEERRIK